MTFDLPLFTLLSACAVAAIAVAMPAQVKRMLRGRPDITAPLPLVVAGAIVQQSLFATGLAAAGVALAPKTGLSAPWFAAVAHGEGLAVTQLTAQLPAALLAGGSSALVFLWLYYRFFLPRMSADDIVRIEESRVAMGLAGRVLVGGIAEEVMFRWGMMSVMAWLVVSVLGVPVATGMWVAIVAAGLLFGLGHLPGVALAGVKLTSLIVATSLTLNLVVSLACGWLFWHYGLLAAMIAHGMVHAAWHPLEKRRSASRTG